MVPVEAARRRHRAEPGAVPLGIEESLALVGQHLQQARRILERNTPAADAGVTWIEHEALARSVDVALQALGELRRSHQGTRS